MRRWAAVLAPLLLVACVPARPPASVVATAPSGPGEPARTVAYQCQGEGGMTARFQGGSVRLFLAGRSVLLPVALSASGARYAGPGGEFWDKGGEARLTIDGHQRSCVALDSLDPWAEAKLSGVSFRALGQEPSWVLEMRPLRGVSFATGIPPQAARWPWERPGHSGTARVWNLSAPQGTLTIFATPRPCRDSMSGEAFTHTVTIISPAGSVQGCGRDLE